jgi:hypothetical protein
MSLLYSRVTPYGFVDPATAKDEDKFYAEEVSLGSAAAEKSALRKAEALRAVFVQSQAIQTRGFGSQEQAHDMAEVLKNV